MERRSHGLDAVEVVLSWGGNPQETILVRDARAVVVGDGADAAIVLPREVVGEGFTLLAPEECLLAQRTQVRNPGLGRGELEAALRA